MDSDEEDIKQDAVGKEQTESKKCLKLTSTWIYMANMAVEVE